MTVDAMRVYVCADMEGVTGLVEADDVQPGGRDHERGRSMMAEDGSAAARGALAAGASDVLVDDAHGPMRHLRPDGPHPAARLVRGRPKQMITLERLTGEYDAVVCVGRHARAGAPGVLSHGFMGHEIEDIRLAGRPTGEIGLAHATAAALGAAGGGPHRRRGGVRRDGGVGRVGGHRPGDVRPRPLRRRAAARGGGARGDREALHGAATGRGDGLRGGGPGGPAPVGLTRTAWSPSPRSGTASPPRNSLPASAGRAPRAVAAVVLTGPCRLPDPPALHVPR